MQVQQFVNQILSFWLRDNLACWGRLLGNQTNYEKTAVVHSDDSGCINVARGKEKCLSIF